MIRTQVSLSEEDYQAAKSEARRQGMSLAEFFRRALRRSLPVDRRKPWMKLAGMVQSGDPDSSQKIDEVIYGHKE